MGRPVTPFCGCDVFVTDSLNRVLLIKRSDNGFWALPGGCQNLDETAKECAVRECKEESGLDVQIVSLMGVWSSLRYPYVHYPWKDNVFTHIVFRAVVVGGSVALSDETTAVNWFDEDSLPSLSDGHEQRIKYAYRWLKDPSTAPYFE